MNDAERLGKAWFDCLNSNAMKISGNKRPSKADAEAAIPRCMVEENAIRDSINQMRSDPRYSANSSPYDKISTDDMIAEFRKHHIWEISFQHNFKRP